jgi:hypothetical protein
MILSKRPGNRVGIACFVIGVAQGKRLLSLYMRL